MEFNLNTRKHFHCVGGQTQEQITQRGWGVAVLGDLQILTECDSGQPGTLTLLEQGNSGQTLQRHQSLSIFLSIQESKTNKQLVPAYITFVCVHFQNAIALSFLSLLAFKQKEKEKKSPSLGFFITYCLLLLLFLLQLCGHRHIHSVN